LSSKAVISSLEAIGEEKGFSGQIHRDVDLSFPHRMWMESDRKNLSRVVIASSEEIWLSNSICDWRCYINILKIPRRRKFFVAQFSKKWGNSNCAILRVGEIY